MKWLWLCGAAVVVTAGVLLFAPSSQAADGPPQITHSVAGREACLSCHGPQTPKPVPATHASFNEATCLGCHAVSQTSAPAQTGSSACLSCHGNPGMTMKFPDGDTLSVTVDAAKITASVHGSKLLCTDCHSAITGYPHPKVEAPSRRAFSAAQYELCKSCHFVNYTKSLDSIHFQLQSQGNAATPLCTDCHGAHDVTIPAQPRSKISTTCSQCHDQVFDKYADSVHGKALIGNNNYDVPVCTDCHSAHTIADPLTASFRMESVEMCSNCHGNKKLMEKYGLSTSVVKTYLDDFHGATVALVSKQDKEIWPKEAVCTDCHGVHDIQSVTDPNSPVIKENLAVTCQKCHEGATANFSGAWLSHYEPTLEKTPAVFLVRLLYFVLIPFIVIGFSIHILLDIWRTVSNR
jgi:predicted CXXCH cytochrome family protein